MTDVEKFLKLKGERDTLQSKLNGIPAEVSRLSTEIDPLIELALRAEIEGDRNATNHRVQIDKSKQQISDLEAEQKELALRSKVMGELLAERRSKAAAELAGVHDKLFRTAVKAFGKALREAQKAEVDLVKVFNAAHAAFNEIDSQSPLPTWEPQFVKGAQDPDINSKLTGFLDRWTAQGYDISK